MSKPFISGEGARFGTGFYTPVSKPKAIIFALCIILGMGGIVVAAVGWSGFGIQKGICIGDVTHAKQMNAIIMMAVGGGSGVLLLLAGVVGMIKNKKETKNNMQFVIAEEMDSK